MSSVFEGPAIGQFKIEKKSIYGISMSPVLGPEFTFFF